MVSGPVTTAWGVIRLRMEQWPPIWRVAASILNNHSRTADKGRTSSLVVLYVSMYVCLCMYVCMYVCMLVYVCIMCVCVFMFVK